MTFFGITRLTAEQIQEVAQYVAVNLSARLKEPKA